MIPPRLTLLFSFFSTVSSKIRSLVDPYLPDSYLAQLEAWERTIRNQRYIIWVLVGVILALLLTASIV